MKHNSSQNRPQKFYHFQIYACYIKYFEMRKYLFARKQLIQSMKNSLFCDLYLGEFWQD